MNKSWRKISIGELCYLKAGGTPNRNEPNFYGGSINWVKSGEVSGTDIYHTEESITTHALQNSSAKLLESNAVLLAMYGATAGQVARLKVPAATNQAVLAITPKQKNIDLNFLYFLLEQSKDGLLDLCQGSGQPNLSNSLVKDFIIKLPPLREQKKIAEILTSHDESIASIKKVIAKLYMTRKSVITSVMKNVEKNSIKTSLGETVEIINGRAYKLTEWENHGTPVIRLQNLTNHGGDFYYSNLCLPEKQYCNKGDLLFMWSGSFGPYIWWGEKAIYHYHIWKMIPKNNLLLKDFLYLFLSYKTDEWKSNGDVMAIIHLTKIGMEKEQIPLPDINKQNRFIRVIKSIDNRIAAEERRLQKHMFLKFALSRDLLSGHKKLRIC